jgi:hypothetical protein
MQIFLKKFDKNLLLYQIFCNLSNLKKVFLIIITYFIKFVNLFAFFPEKTPILPGFGAFLAEFAREMGKRGLEVLDRGHMRKSPLEVYGSGHMGLIPG